MNWLTLVGFLSVVVFAVCMVMIDKKEFNKKNMIKSVALSFGAVIALFIAIYTTARSVVRPALISDPTMLMDAGEAYQKTEMEKREKAAKKALKNITEEDFKHAPIIGNAEGNIVVYEFFDYNCGYCKKGNETLKEVLEKEKDVKVVLKHFPIYPPSQFPAKASIASREQGIEKASAFHHALFKSELMPKNVKNMKEADAKIKVIVMDIAKKSGLDVKKLEKDIENPAVEEELLRTRDLAKKLGIEGTPAFVIGDKFVPGYINTNQMIEAIKQIRK